MLPIVAFVISDFRVINNEERVEGRRYINTEPFFLRPLNSSIIAILKVGQLNEEIEIFNKNNILLKFFRIMADGETIIIPLLHNSNK